MKAMLWDRNQKYFIAGINYGFTEAICIGVELPNNALDQCPPSLHES